VIKHPLAGSNGVWRKGKRSWDQERFFLWVAMVTQAANWYTMDSIAINKLLAALVRLGFTRLFRKESIRVVTRWFFRLLAQFPGGEDDVCALAEHSTSFGRCASALEMSSLFRRS
jgi:hypothetical protein